MLGDELNAKHAQIIALNQERETLEDISETALGMSMQTSEQTQEIQRLNGKYRKAINAKLALYKDFCESIQVLIQRDTRYLQNQLDDASLKSETTIIKRELEQFESRQHHDPALSVLIDAKITKYREIRREIKDAENDSEFLNFVLRRKEAAVEESNEEGGDAEVMSVDRRRRT